MLADEIEQCRAPVALSHQPASGSIRVAAGSIQGARPDGGQPIADQLRQAGVPAVGIQARVMRRRVQHHHSAIGRPALAARALHVHRVGNHRALVPELRATLARVGIEQMKPVMRCLYQRGVAEMIQGRRQGLRCIHVQVRHGDARDPASYQTDCHPPRAQVRNGLLKPLQRGCLVRPVPPLVPVLLSGLSGARLHWQDRQPRIPVPGHPEQQAFLADKGGFRYILRVLTFRRDFTLAADIRAVPVAIGGGASLFSHRRHAASLPSRCATHSARAWREM